MTRRGALEVAVAAAYLAAALTVSYAIWGRYDGVAYEPAWAGGTPFLVALGAVHVVVGAAIGRWRALALPVAWAGLSVGAEGYDTPVAVLIAFTLPVYWLPAVVLGVGLRRLGEGRAVRPS